MMLWNLTKISILTVSDNWVFWTSTSVIHQLFHNLQVTVRNLLWKCYFAPRRLLIIGCHNHIIVFFNAFSVLVLRMAASGSTGLKCHLKTCSTNLTDKDGKPSFTRTGDVTALIFLTDTLMMRIRGYAMRKSLPMPVTIDAMTNLDDDTDGHCDGDVTCKQILKTFKPVSK